MSKTNISVEIENLDELNNLLEKYEVVTKNCLQLINLGVGKGTIEGILEALIPENKGDK